nr:MltA domain-containing protein [Amylibacter sp.]
MTVKAVSFADLPGWETDDHAAALAVFVQSCDKIRENSQTRAQDWAEVCAFARRESYAKNTPKATARAFFELFFQPVLIEDGAPTLFTGYYEPEIIGSRFRAGKFQYPLYKRPREMKLGSPWKTRAEIESGALAGRNLELAWLADPVENFFLHVQGSGRIKLNEGGSMRVGFDGKNGQPYRSIGKEMVRLGILSAHKASAGRIKAWVRKNPNDGRRILQHNPSFVFFRELAGLDPDAGPPGAMGVSVSTGRTIAVDDDYTPLGAPVWIDKRGRDPIRRLMVAQDVGSAIKGAQRADVYYGSGAEAGRIAGRIKDAGRMYTLLPHASVKRLLPEG